MKKYCVIWIAFFMVGCANHCCKPWSAAASADRIIGGQLRESTVNTSANIRTIGNYIKKDFRESPKNMGETAALIYKGVSFERSKREIPTVFNLFGKQAREGMQNLRHDFKTVGSCLCLCRDHK